MSFNVSIGDFISTINLAMEIFGALEKSCGSAAQFQDLKATLETLKDALKDTNAFIANLEPLSKAIKRTDSSIERFLKRVEKYQPSLQVGGSKSKWKDAMRKIQWSLYQKDDVNNFQSEISLQVTSIQLLVLGAYRTALETKTNKIVDLEDRMASASVRLTETTASVMNLSALLSKYAMEFQNILLSILRINVAVLYSLMSRRVSLTLPKSVCWDQPVTFQDATGRRFPINVGFVDCWESFEFALLNIHKGRPGFDAVERHDYRLQNACAAGTWTEIFDDMDFKQAFVPGAFIDMTAMFPCDPYRDFECLKCGWPVKLAADMSMIKCQNLDCDLRFVQSDYLRTHVLALPSNLEIPPLPLIWPGDEGRDGEDQVTSKSCSIHEDVCDDKPNQSDSEQLEGSYPEYYSHNRATLSKIDDFKNIYVLPPPGIMVRDRSKRWYDIPWRVARSYDGIKFIIDHYTSDANTSYKLRDRELDKELSEDQWEAQAWPGMIVEIEDRLSGDASDTAPHFAMPAPASPPSTALHCYLCRKAFGSQTVLARHTASNHLLRGCIASGSPEQPQRLLL